MNWRHVITTLVGIVLGGRVCIELLLRLKAEARNISARSVRERETQKLQAPIRSFQLRFAERERHFSPELGVNSKKPQTNS